MVTVRIMSIDKDKITGLEIGRGDKNYGKNNIIDIEMNRIMYLGMLAEMKKANIDIDGELRCFDNRIFTIIEMTWGITLRKDLEKIWNAKNN